MLTSTVKFFFISLFLLITLAGKGITPSTILVGDSLDLPKVLPKDSLTKKNNSSNTFLKSKVKYNADDSIRFDVTRQKIYLFGNAQVTFEKIKLNAAYVELNMKDNVVFAEGIKDSLGKEKGTPVFEENGQVFNSKKMSYNFKSKKGKIIEVITKESDGYIHGETVKKDSNNVFYIKNGKYTTCDNVHPHFYIGASKLKVIPNEKIITGPANLYVGDVPTPLILPFGFFPNKKGRASGILIPSYGESQAFGFYLQDGGYYMGISDRIDMAIKGTVFSKQSWAATLHANYSSRYKFNGFFDFQIKRTILDELAGISAPKPTRDFSLKWIYNQDSKARPGTTFSADVNIISSAAFNNIGVTNPTTFLNNTYSSSINYAKHWPTSHLQINARHSQNTRSKTVDLTIPSLTFNTNTFYPFANKSRITSKWYDKINLNYSASMENKISAYDSTLFKEDIFRKMQNGIRHSIPINLSLPVLKFFTLGTNIQTQSIWYTQTVTEKYDTIKKSAVIADTIRDFRMANSYSLSSSLASNLYGNYYFRHGRIKQIRHKITPSIGFSYTPDFSEDKYGYYNNVRTNAAGSSEKYSIFQQGIFGSPPKGKSDLVTFSMSQNLEMKVKSKSDTVTNVKKISLLDYFNITSSYNVAVDSFNLANFNFGGATKLFKTINANFNGTLDPYAVNSEGRRTKEYEWNENKKIGRVTNASLSLSGNLKGKASQTKKTSTKGTKEELENINAHPEAYVDFSIPWSLSINYSINYQNLFLRHQFIDTITSQSVGFNGEFSLTPKWKINFSNLGYDFIRKNFTSPALTIYRDLHCWDLSLNWIPFGFHQSYNLTVKVKSAVLQDLKLNRKRDYYDY